MAGRFPGPGRRKLNWIREEQARDAGAREAEKEAAPARPAPEQDDVRPARPRRIPESGEPVRLAELCRQAMERDRPQRPDRDRGHSMGYDSGMISNAPDLVSQAATLVQPDSIVIDGRTVQNRSATEAWAFDVRSNKCSESRT